MIGEGDPGLLNLPDGEPRRDVGELTPAVIEILSKILETSGTITVPDVIDAKYRLFTEAYFPHKNQNAAHPLVSYVLFMPESDLKDYHRTIERCVNTSGVLPYDKKRELLFEVYSSLVNQFTGQKLNKKVEEYTREELRNLMQGVYKMGLDLSDPLEHKLGDVKDEKKIPNTGIDTLFGRFVEVEKNLSAVLKEGKSYKFCYSTDQKNLYYWIKMTDAF